MIPFFRRIRRKLADNNQLLKYSRYAIGEIVLVVIGILIALQINNWNVKKNQQEKIKEYAKLYIKDLEADIVMTKINWDMINSVSEKIDSLGLYVQNKNIEDISNIDFLCMTWNILYRPYKWNRSTIDHMKGSGTLQYIKDVSISRKIGKYDALTYHLDEDYLNDKAKSEISLSLISQVVNIEYVNIIDLRKSVLININNPELNRFHYYLEPEYLKCKKNDLRVITEDINDIKKVMNSLIRLQAYYDIRSKIELPQLTADAEELISLLKAEYSEQ